MKILYSTIVRCTLGFVLLVSVNIANAQYISTHNADGTLKTVEQRKAEEAENARKNALSSSSTSSGLRYSSTSESRKELRDYLNKMKDGKKAGTAFLKSCDYVGTYVVIPGGASGYRIVSKYDKWGIFTSQVDNNFMSGELFYEDIKEINGGKLKAKKDGKYGVIDYRQAWVFVPFAFDDILSYGNPSEVINDGKKFEIDSEGNVVGAITDIATGKIEPEMIPEPGSFTDARDKKIYETIKIASHTYMSQNLDAAFFRNGDAVPLATSFEVWANANVQHLPVSCYYNFDPENGKKYGKLYNLYAVMDPRGLAPEGWHIPSDKEWDRLANDLYGDKYAGIKLKSSTGWEIVKGNEGNNKSGFNGLPGGMLYINYESKKEEFVYIGTGEYWGSSTEVDDEIAIVRGVGASYTKLEYFKAFKKAGVAVRCIKD